MKIYVAIPAMNESEYIKETIECIRKQKTNTDFEVFVNVNNGEQSSDQTVINNIYKDNQKSISYLNSIRVFPLTIIDRSSKGKSMEKGKEGVGWARKIVMDMIAEKADKDDIMISLDADTVFNEYYFQSIIDNFKKNKDVVALSVPYYHNLTKDNTLNRAILRYEIYMRYYIINLMRIDSPYSFTALGSAIALPISSYRAIMGLTPKKSGEDFYFLQKLCKYGKVMIWNEEIVHPSSRYSDRVFFGTGPALIKGSNGDWSSYPIYDYRDFDNIKETYNLFNNLYQNDVETPMSEFIYNQFGSKQIWEELRKNSPDEKKFIRACHTKIDGLRILQYLKNKNEREKNGNGCIDEKNLKEFLNKFYKVEIKNEEINLHELSFAESNIEELNKMRNFLFNEENKLRIEK